MIARVKIAPIEYWCEPIREATGEFKYPPGTTVDIITESMIMNSYPGCGGRLWDITRESSDKLTALGADEVDNPAVCEHMLEMD